MYKIRLRERRMIDKFRCVDSTMEITCEKIFKPENTNQLYCMNRGYVNKVINTEDIIQIKEAKKKMLPKFTKNYFCFDCETESNSYEEVQEYRPYGDYGCYETMYYCVNCGSSAIESTSNIKENFIWVLE